jgi:hypothetical protein
MTDTRLIITFIGASVFGAVVSAVLTYASPEMCIERTPAASLRPDCSIRINKGLLWEKQDCLKEKHK